jgi:superfamily II DNA or RNA helicase
MAIPYSSEDLGRAFDARTLARGRTLLLAGSVALHIDGDTIEGVVKEGDRSYRGSLTPVVRDGRVGFTGQCSCGQRNCLHLAASALGVLDKYPEWRRQQQQSFLASLLAAPPKERTRLVFLLEPGEAGACFYVSPVLEHDRTGQVEPVSPRRIGEEIERSPGERALARLIGGDETRVAVAASEPQAAARLIDQLVGSGLARWKPSNKRIVKGPQRVFDAAKPPDLPAKSAVLRAGTNLWYVDAHSGHLGLAVPRAPIATSTRKPAAPVARETTGRRGTIGLREANRRAEPVRTVPRATPADLVILDRPMVPVLRLARIEGPDEMGRVQQIDALTLAFGYDRGLAEPDDERQFVRVEDGTGEPTFLRRDRPAEAKAEAQLREEGFMQIRVQIRGQAKGKRIYLYRGKDAGERWQRFITERVPALEALGWRAEIEEGFGPQIVDVIGEIDMRLADEEGGWFSLELGIEVEGERLPLLPILSRILDQGGLESMPVVDGKIRTQLDDGRILALPVERIARMLATMSDLIEAAQRTGSGSLLLPASEAPAVLDLEEVLIARWQNAAHIRHYVERFRDDLAIEAVPVPDRFKGTLRPYQAQGLDWLQHLSGHGMAGILADDMGLGKTAQTIAHIVAEHDAGRLDRPVLIVLPTSLVANWSAELGKFAPHLSRAVLHGLDRHQRRQSLGGTQVVITTYTVLARDIDIMAEMEWHLVVLDEAQAIKSPESKTFRAVCQLKTRHKLCLSGTPIENNLEELWAQFAFLMPGLLGDRRGFAKRFRTPIEKKGDEVRRDQLIRRIRPFILRRTKAEVASDLPPKHTIIRRVSLAAEQRELYETIRVTLYDKLRHELAERNPGQGKIVLLDALLKLRQVCCDPRLVKLPAARDVEISSKLDELMEMMVEMIAEGRRILLFSQFTSMLDLIKEAVRKVGIDFVELRGDTADRATPVKRFEALEVPLFLISLKAGGRGLNLTSADTVIHYDPWWNPAAEEQASDRAHRIGQTKSVFVYKLIAAGTVEERIVELQERKAALANIALGAESEFAGIELDDIDYLFGEVEGQEAA